MINRQITLDELMDTLNHLKPDEREVMFLRAKGLSYRCIADEVYKCKSTVQKIVKQVENEYGESI